MADSRKAQTSGLWNQKDQGCRFSALADKRAAFAIATVTCRRPAYDCRIGSTGSAKRYSIDRRGRAPANGTCNLGNAQALPASCHPASTQRYNKGFCTDALQLTTTPYKHLFGLCHVGTPTVSRLHARRRLAWRAAPAAAGGFMLRSYSVQGVAPACADGGEAASACQRGTACPGRHIHAGALYVPQQTTSHCILVSRCVVFRS